VLLVSRIKESNGRFQVVRHYNNYQLGGLVQRIQFNPSKLSAYASVTINYLDKTLLTTLANIMAITTVGHVIGIDAGRKSAKRSKYPMIAISDNNDTTIHFCWFL
jgi:hypothetical protein